MIHLARCICLIFLFFSSSIFGQSRLILPIHKNGNWYLKSKGNELKLPENYHYVGNFDQKGTAFFDQNGFQGVLDGQGNELIKATYLSVSPLNHGFYLVSDDEKQQVVSILPETIHFTCDTLVQLEENWVYVEEDTIPYLFNLLSRKKIEIQSPKNVVKHFQNFLILSDSSRVCFQLFDPTGVLQDEGESIFSNEMGLPSIFQSDFDYFIWRSDRFTLAVDSKGIFPLKKDAKEVWISEDYIHFSDAKKAYLVDRETRKEEFSYPCDQIFPYENGLFVVWKKNKSGLVDRNGKLILPIQFDYISYLLDYVEVRIGDCVGLYDAQYQQVLPCKFTRYNEVDDLFYVRSVSNSVGLYSKKYRKEILPAVYDQIKLEGTLLKAWNGRNLNVMQLNEKHQIFNQVVLENAVTIRSNQSSFMPLNIDARLLALGWFYDTISRVDASKRWIGTAAIWGLKNQQDSVLLTPRYNRVIFLPNSCYSLLVNPIEKNEMINYRFTRWSNGKDVNQFRVLHVDSTQAKKHPFFRFSHTGGWGIALQSDSLIDVAYVDCSNEPYIRFCANGTQEFCEPTDPIATPYINPADFPFASWNQSSVYYDAKTKKLYTHVKYIFGKWNYLDSAGNRLFDQDFEFAEKFHKGYAIVKTEKGWGVVNAKGFVIDPIYAEVKRVSAMGDTVFQVKKVPSATFLTNGYFEKKDMQLPAPDRTKGSLRVYDLRGKKQVFHTDFGMVKETGSSVRLEAFDQFVIKNKKVFEIYDRKGSLLGESTVKPEVFLGEGVFLAEIKSRLGVLDVLGDTLIPFQYKSIEKCGDWYLALQAGIVEIRDEKGELLKRIEGKKVFVDSLTYHWVEQDNEKVTVYNELGKKMAKFKLEGSIAHFYNGLLFVPSGKGQVFSETGEKVNNISDWASVEFFSSGYFLLKSADKVDRLFNQNWEEVLSNYVQKKRFRFVSDSIVSFVSQKNHVLYHLHSGAFRDDLSRVEGSYESGFIMVSTDRIGMKSFYLNKQFENTFHRSYLRAKPFHQGLASVMFSSGWTVIDQNGKIRSYPNLGEIEVLGNDFLKVKHLPLYGVIAPNNRIILPVEFEKIEWVHSLFRLSRSGELFYLDLEGKEVLLD